MAAPRLLSGRGPMEGTSMNMTEKIALWGATHAAARDAERAASQHAGASGEALRREAQRLRERADSLHREVCTTPGTGHKPSNASERR